MSQKYLIKKARLIQLGNEHHLKVVDVLFDKLNILKIAENITDDAKEISGKELIITQGWVDMFSKNTDPGFEHKDTLTNLQANGAIGGFTHLCVSPDSQPVVDSKSAIKYTLNHNENHTCTLLPVGAISLHGEGKELSEMYDMHSNGAVAFGHSFCALEPSILKKALLYTKPFGGKIISFPLDKNLMEHGLVNEGKETIHTGLKTSPSLAEYTVIQQQLAIAKYCEAPIHFTGISCAESVDLIATAKKEGLAVTCDVSIFNLCFTEAAVVDFDENFKLLPFLRTQTDKIALIEGVNNGTIDAISSYHNPQSVEDKNVEFAYAEFGAMSLPFVFSWYLRYLAKDIPLPIFIEKLTTGPQKILGLESVHLKSGNTPNFSVFDIQEEWKFDEKSNPSLCRNTHEWGKMITGKTIISANNQKINIL